ncbi:MAG: efflux RND transporter periplasmic adaptor subunit [Cellulomonadaceae bacterium]|nr:efflux RND transporter periplasmic adaptor subunit [Cellulomonadaceae bacterium]
MRAIARPEFAVNAPTSGWLGFWGDISEGVRVNQDQVLFTVGSGDSRVNVTSPASGVVTSVFVEDRGQVRSGVPVVAIRYDGFGVTGAIPIERAFQLTENPVAATIQFVAGPGPQPCTPTPLVSATPDGDGFDGQTPLLQVLCLIEDTVGVVDGSPAVMGLITSEASDVLILPLEAVAGNSGNGVVSKLDTDGKVVRVEVGLGISDGVDIEITSGLTEDDRVLPFGPNVRQEIRQ